MYRIYLIKERKYIILKTYVQALQLKEQLRAAGTAVSLVTVRL